MFKKMVAPIIFTIVVLLFILLYFFLVILTPIDIWIKIIAGAILVLLCGTAIYVLVERIKEIRSGEEDDLSKY